jgi:AcrR family transcriptional regulator
MSQSTPTTRDLIDPRPGSTGGTTCLHCAELPAPPDVTDLSWKDASPEQRRELILQTALGLLHDAGPDAVTMRGIAQRLGLGAMTLYTYVDSAEALQRDMIRRGFATLHRTCCTAGNEMLQRQNTWRGGAQAYLDFARHRPNLYRLMFESPLPASDHDLLEAGFAGLLQKVRLRLADRGVAEPELSRKARAEAGRYWVALHGLAMIIIADRTSVLEGGLDDVLTDLLEHAAPRC